MAEQLSHELLDDVQETLSWNISRGEFEKALQAFIERKAEIPSHRRRFYLSCIEDGLSGHKTYRRVIRTAILMALVNLLLQPLFSVQLLDALAFLSPVRFLYYNYFSAALPELLNLFFVLGLLIQWHTWVALPARLFEQRIAFPYRAAFFGFLALLGAYVILRLVPFALDFPMVRSGGYLTSSISEEEDIAGVYGEVIRTSGREDVAATLRQQLWDEYGRSYPDDVPPPYFKNGGNPARPNQLYMDTEGEYYALSDLQLRASPVDREQYPIVIRYLRHTKQILQIVSE